MRTIEKPGDRPDPQGRDGVSRPAPAGEVRLRAAHISKRFGRRQILTDVSLEVRAGEVAAVVGSNGAGKSTFLKICAGLLSPTDGQIQVSGSIGYCPQEGGRVRIPPSG